MKLLLLTLLVALTVALPYTEQMLLANSMIVGRDDQLDLINWECNVCEESNRPLHAHYIEEKGKDIKCVLSTYPKFHSLAFRYTNTLLNVWQDILYANQIVDTNVCTNCKIQKAYKGMWDTIREDVISDLKAMEAQTKLKQLYITGISLGGGLAVISYIDILKSKIFDKVDVITFGAPRVANKYYADYFDDLTGSKSKRYAVKGDPIVVMPECLTVLCNYKHTGSQYTCIENDEKCTKDKKKEVKGFLHEMLWKKRADDSMKNLGSIVDHIYGYKKIYNFTEVEE